MNLQTRLECRPYTRALYQGLVDQACLSQNALEVLSRPKVTERAWRLLNLRANPNKHNPTVARIEFCLGRAGFSDPFRLSPQVRTFVRDLIGRHRPPTNLDFAVLALRAVVPSDWHFSFRGERFFGLKAHQGGLEVKPNDDFKHPQRARREGYLTPDHILQTASRDRVALCAEYSFLIVTLLRAKGIEAYIKMEKDHAYVYARIDGRNYKIDATYPKIEPCGDFEHTEDIEVLHKFFEAGSGIMYRQGKLYKALKLLSYALEIRETSRILGLRGRFSYDVSVNLVFDSKKRCLESALRDLDRAIELGDKNRKTFRTREKVLEELANF